MRFAAAGVNFIDVYQRTGFYPVESLPSGLGKEGAGTVTSTAWAGPPSAAAWNRPASAAT